MHINIKLLKVMAAPWVVVGALAVGCFFIISCGGDTSVDAYLQNIVMNAALVVTAFDGLCLVGYLSFPHLAGLTCVWLAKNWKKIDQLATLSASLKYDVVTKGGYYKLYKKGVRTYNSLNRGVKYDSTKSRSV